MSTFGRSARRAGVVVAASLGAGIAATGKATIDFDKSMRNVNSIAQLNEKQFQKLQKSVLGLAGPTAQAPKTIADGMYDLVSSNFSAQESLQIVEKSAKAATAGLTTTEVSTKAVAAVLNAYHLPAKKAGVVSDQLFRTVERGVITFEDLASNVGDVLPFASSLGIGLDQVGASIATMTKAGIPAPETMTRVKNVMVAMLKPSEGLKKAYKELGVGSGESLIKQKGFQGSLEALIGTTDGSKKAVAKLFPEIRAMGGAFALTGKNVKGAREDLDKMGKSAGATDRALAEQSKSIAYAWQQIKAEVTAAAIGIGSKAIPAIMGFVREVRTGTGAGGDFRHAIENIGAAIAPIAILVGQASLAVGKLGLDFAQTQTAMVLVGAAVGALTGKMVGLGVAFAAGKIIPFAAAVVRTVSVLQSAIAVSGGLRTAMILLTASTRGLTVAMASTGFGVLAIIAGTAIGALMGFGRASDDSASSQRDLASAIKGTHDALDSIANADLDAKQAKIDHRAAVANLEDAEKQLGDVRKNPKASAAERERAEIAVAQARVDLRRKTREMRNSERDYQDTVRSGMSEAARNVQTLRDERDERRKRRGETRKGVDELKDEIVTMQRTGATAKQLKPKLQELREKQRELRRQTILVKDAQKDLRGAIRGVRDTAADATPKIKNFGDKLRGLKPFTKVELELIASGAPKLRDLSDFADGGKRNRKGGFATFQAGGMVPSILSPGEVGVLPNGSSFTVPGARVAADTVPMMLPRDTAVLTGHGQRLVSAGASIADAVSWQMPHFREGGVVQKFAAGGLAGATAGASTLRAAGVKDPRQLVIQTATGGRESRWDPKAKGGPNSNGTFDHGWLQANDIWASKMGNLWDQRYTFEGGSKIAKKIADAQGPSAWRLNGWNVDSTIQPFMGTAQKAVKRAMAGKGFSFAKVTQPKITNPLLGNMLAPLTDDALMGGIEAGRTGASRLPLLTETLEGIVPEAEDRPSREKVSVSGSRAAAGKNFKPGGGWAGTKNLVMQAISGLGQSWTFKRSVAVNGNQDSDHNTWIKNAYAADGSPGSDRVFNTIGKRLGVPAAKGSWNSFSNAPLDGYRSQLLWHAPDGSHKDHVHLGIRKMRKGGFVSMRNGGVAGKRLKVGEKVGGKDGRRRFDDDSGIVVRGGKVVRVLATVPKEWRKLPVSPIPGGPGLHGLVGLLGGSPGTDGADALTRRLASRVPNQSFGRLRRSERFAKRQIRGMAKQGFTGPERIKTRRLRGALSLLQDEQGRRIGEPLGASDRDQEYIARSESNLPNFLNVAGIDAESVEGLRAQRQVGGLSLKALKARQRGNKRALKLAERTGNKDAIAAAEGEVNEVADQMLGLRSSLKDFDEQIKERTGPLAQANRDLGLAGLTADTEDDRQALTKLRDIAAQQLEEAQRSGDPQAIADAAGELKGAVEALAAATPTGEDFANAALAMAGLTETTEDDRAALVELQRLAQAELDAALQTADPRDDIEAANNLKQLNDSLKSLDETIAQANEIQKQREDYEKERLEVDKELISLATTQGPTILAATIAAAEGWIGGNAATAGRVPATAGVPASYR